MAASPKSPRNDVAQHAAASSDSDPNHNPTPRASVKRKLSMDEPRSTRKKVSYNETSNRLWSHQDVLVLLQSIIDYRSAYNTEPNADYSAFFHFVKDKLRVNELSVRQLREKVRKLRNKYSAKCLKYRGGDEIDKVFELSEKIWGKKEEDVKDDDVVVTENEGEEKARGSGFEETYPYLSEAWGTDFELPRHLKELGVRNFMMVGGEKMRELECEWKGVFAEELKLDVRKLDLKVRVVKVVLDEMEASEA